MMALSAATVSEIKTMQQRMPTPRAALLFALRLVQTDAGCIGHEEVIALSDLFRLSPMQVAGVARFYDLLSEEPSSRERVRICEGVVCLMRGADTVWDALNKFAVNGSVDGLEFEKAACLGHCDYAPAAFVNGQLVSLESASHAPDRIDSARRGGRGNANDS